MTQNQIKAWPRILAEGAAIIVSILLAFSIDAWWEGREEDKRGQLYLLGLREDIIQIEDELGEHIDFITGVMKDAEKVLTMATGTDAELLTDSFSKTLGNTYSISSTNLSTPTYHDIINSGNLRLVKNSVLRMKMAKMVELLKTINDQYDVINENYWRHHAPFVDKHFVVSKFDWFSGTTTEFSGTTTEVSRERAKIIGKLPETPFNIDVSAVRTREFWNLIYDLITTHGDQLGPTIEARTLCRELLLMLDEEIGRPRL
jgi:hypothetical protein